MKNLSIAAVVFFALNLAALPAAAQTVKKWVDEHGVTHYSDQKPVDGEAEEVEVPEANVTGFDGESTQQRIEKKLQEFEQERAAREQEAEQKDKARALQEALDREPIVAEEKKKKDKKGSRNKYQGPYPKPITERLPKPPNSGGQQQ